VEPQKVLLVEDNPDDVTLTQRAFQKRDGRFDLTVARDGEKALSLLFGNNGHAPFTPAFMLLDINLPKIDGLEVLRQIREHPQTHRIPVVIMTASSADEAFLESYSLGVDAYMRKPIDARQVDAALRQLKLSSLLTGELP
jgi:two-component system response regulator